MKAKKKFVGCWICRDGKQLGFPDCFMVKDSVWLSAGLPLRDKCVHVEAHLGCLQKRLGRNLTADDFTRCALNDWNKEVQAIRKL
jgi:hypothetical protein